MSLSFQQLRHFKDLGLNYSAVLVKAFLDENGFTPIGIIAEACDLSTRSVERALVALKARNLLSQKGSTSMTHDHAVMDHGNKGTATQLTGDREHQADTVDDPIRSRLIEHEVLPWCVDALIAKCDRQLLVQQLEYHEYRLAHGFKFRGHPARYLFSACLHNYAPPEGFFAARHKAQEGPLNEPKVPQHPPAPTKPITEAPVNEPATAEQRAETIQQMLASPIPGVRRLAAKLAADWGVALPSSIGKQAV